MMFLIPKSRLYYVYSVFDRSNFDPIVSSIFAMLIHLRPRLLSKAELVAKYIRSNFIVFLLGSVPTTPTFHLLS